MVIAANIGFTVTAALWGALAFVLLRWPLLTRLVEIVVNFAPMTYFLFHWALLVCHVGFPSVRWLSVHNAMSFWMAGFYPRAALVGHSVGLVVIGARLFSAFVLVDLRRFAVTANGES